MAANPKTLFAVFAAFAAFVATSPARAALGVPSVIGPANGAVVEVLPSFGWSPVPGADHYEFQIAADAGFNAPVLGRGEDAFFTRNTRATLKKTVPNGTYWWRLRAATPEGDVSAWTAPRSFRKTWTGAASLQSPNSGAQLTFPTNPLRLGWSPVAGAAHYLVSVATDPLLGSLVALDEGSTTSPPKTAAVTWTREASLAPGTYYWGVTPVDAEGNKGVPSRVASFVWVWPSTTTPAVTDLDPAPEVYDPQFSWDPVSGAARYEVEINPSSDFAPGSKVCCTGATISTSLSPTKVFKDNTYYWRVRAIDPDGNAGVWNQGPSFTKTFDNVPPTTAPSVKNLHMRDNLTDPGTDTDVLTAGYQTQAPMVVWNPVPGAASYEVDVTPFQSGSCNWTASPLTGHWRPTTAVPGWTPLGSSWNGVKPYPDGHAMAAENVPLTAGWSYCARVRARTDRAGSEDVYGDYTYLDDGTGAAFTFTGYPTGAACAPSCNVGYLGSADYVAPVTGTLNGRTPYFTWKPMAGKQSYFVLVSKDPSFTTIVDYAFTQVPAYAPRTANAAATYSDETTLYYWAVLPATSFNGNGAAGNPLLAAAPNFQKQSTPPALLSPANGAVFMTQPSFRWTPAEGARRYRLQVAQDPSFGDPIDDVLTDSTAYSSDTTYPADTVLYWRVRADDENLVGLTWSPTGTFQKKLPVPTPSAGNPVKSDFLPSWSWSPVEGAVAYDVTVDFPDGEHKDALGMRMPVITPLRMTGTGVWAWRVRAVFPKATTSGTVAGPWTATQAFTRTITEPASPRTDADDTHVLLSWDPKLAIKDYKLQISSRPDFASTVEDIRTDNPSYAPRLSNISYLKGGTLYWRVAGVDEDDNVGDFTPTQQISLLPQLKLRVVGKIRRGRLSTIYVRVVDGGNGAVKAARVMMRGTGLRKRVKTTDKLGSVKFRFRAKRKGRVVFQASKPGYQPTGITLRIR